MKEKTWALNGLEKWGETKEITRGLRAKIPPKLTKLSPKFKIRRQKIALAK